MPLPAVPESAVGDDRWSDVRRVQPSDASVVIEVTVRRDDAVDACDVDVDLAQPVSQDFVAHPIGESGVDQCDALVIAQRVAVDMAEPGEVDRQHDANDAGCDLGWVIVSSALL